MEPGESGVFGRRPMDIEDYLIILRRNIPWMVGPLIAGFVIAVVVACFWTDTYVSTAAIRVLPPQVPEKLVSTNLSIQMADRLKMMEQVLSSRSTMLNLIASYDLYREDRNRLPEEDLIDRLHKNIRIAPITTSGSAQNRTGATAYSISFAYKNRYIAQKVTRDIMSRFIEDNAREMSTASKLTTQFLQEQARQAKDRLDKVEKDLMAFRMSHMGSLPDQIQSNMQRITMMESRNAILQTSISRAKQDQMILDSDLRGLREKYNLAQQAAKLGADPATKPDGNLRPGEDPLAAIDRAIDAQQRILDKLLETYRPGYPDVEKAKIRLATLKKDRESMLDRKLAIKDEPVQQASTAIPTGPVRLSTTQAKELADLDQAINKVSTQSKALEMETERFYKEIAANEKAVHDLQSRIDLGPQGAQELDRLMREREMAQEQYDNFKSKAASSEVASELQDRKQGETLETLDLPSLPDSPTSPNRPMIVASGAFIGLGFGICLIAFRELRDNSLKTLKDVRAYTQFNVLGSIPLLENDLVQRRRRRLNVVAWTTAMLLSVLVVSGSVYYYMNTKM